MFTGLSVNNYLCKFCNGISGSENKVHLFYISQPRWFSEGLSVVATAGRHLPYIPTGYMVGGDAGPGDEEINAVDARELHSFLESGQEFTAWIKNRIKQYEFIQDVDFIRFNKVIETTGGRKIEYFVTIDMAKELCMIEKTEIGKRAVIVSAPD